MNALHTHSRRSVGLATAIHHALPNHRLLCCVDGAASQFHVRDRSTGPDQQRSGHRPFRRECDGSLGVPRHPVCAAADRRASIRTSGSCQRLFLSIRCIGLGKDSCTPQLSSHSFNCTCRYEDRLHGMLTRFTIGPVSGLQDLLYLPRGTPRTFRWGRNLEEQTDPCLTPRTTC